MNFQEKIAQLRAEIDRVLTPLITNDYVLLDVPYHGNIGDTLIWQGEEDFLSALPHKCLGVHSCDSWWGNSLHHEAIILLHGGGNFGDLWRSAQEFRLKIIAQHQDHRIIMFPQSIWYDDKSLIQHDASIMARHPDLHLCARDRFSYDFLCRHFSANHIYLVPDMAFHIDDSRLTPYRGKNTTKKLYFRRLDKEIASGTPKTIQGYEIHDWPTIEKTPMNIQITRNIMRGARLLKHLPLVSHYLRCVVDRKYRQSIKDDLIHQGFGLISQYNYVVTTRLHAMILSILLHKPVRYIDNSYGKLSAYYSTWLTDSDAIQEYN